MVNEWRYKLDLSSEPLLHQIEELLKTGISPNLDDDTVKFTGSSKIIVDSKNECLEIIFTKTSFK